VLLQNDFLVSAETERTFMNPKSMVAILMIVTAPVCAQVQKPTRADAQKVFEIISGNEAKTQIFCDIGKLGDEIEQAAERKDTRTTDELRRKIDELGRKLGPEYAALMNGIQDVDPESEDGQQISSTIQALDKLCALE
jgi:mevalonate kinase